VEKNAYRYGVYLRICKVRSCGQPTKGASVRCGSAAVPWPKRLVAGLSPRRPKFVPGVSM
jgi:hypothetical protein